MEHVPLLKNKSVDHSKVFQTLKSLLLDGNFELALLHVQNVAKKLASSEQEKSSSEGETPQSIVDTQELKEELAEAMDTQDSSITTEKSSATTLESSTTTQGSSNTQESATLTEKSNTPPSSPKRVKFSEDTKADKSSENKHETIISSLCKHKDHVKSLSEFYMKHIEESAERQKERDMIRMSSPLFKLYSSKAETDQDRYLDTLGGLLTKVLTTDRFLIARSEIAFVKLISWNFYIRNRCDHFRGKMQKLRLYECLRTPWSCTRYPLL